MTSDDDYVTMMSCGHSSWVDRMRTASCRWHYAVHLEASVTFGALSRRGVSRYNLGASVFQKKLWSIIIDHHKWLINVWDLICPLLGWTVILRRIGFTREAAPSFLGFAEPCEDVGRTAWGWGPLGRYHYEHWKVMDLMQCVSYEALHSNPA